MPRATPFRLNRAGLLLALISTAFAGQAGAAAGRVEFAVGPATVVGADGRTRPAGRGTELDNGDVVRTNDGRVQMRMSDGAFISLQPNTEFGIKDYRYEGRTDGSESALFSLVKGAMRTVTGLIGRINRNKFLVTTPTATVGIRGTGGLIQVLNDGATLVQGTSGIWFLANPAGTIDIPAGVAGIAPVDPKQPPKETVQIPTAGPSPLPALLEFVQGEEREPDGTSVITGGVLQSGGGYAIAAANNVFPFVHASDKTTAVFNGAGQMTEATFGSTALKLGSGGSHADFGTDGILAWGRWIGPVAVTATVCEGTCLEDYSPTEGSHYVIGTPTPVLPTSGLATYALLGFTKPTNVDGTTLPGTFSGTLKVMFSASATIDADFTIAMPSLTTYNLTGRAVTTTATFSISQPSITGCLSTCSGVVQGFFAGTNAERAGVGYQITDNIPFTRIVGTAAFQK